MLDVHTIGVELQQLRGELKAARDAAADAARVHAKHCAREAAILTRIDALQAASEEAFGAARQAGLPATASIEEDAISGPCGADA